MCAIGHTNIPPNNISGNSTMVWNNYKQLNNNNVNILHDIFTHTNHKNINPADIFIILKY